jgi:hypothetical protein
VAILSRHEKIRAFDPGQRDTSLKLISSIYLPLPRPEQPGERQTKPTEDRSRDDDSNLELFAVSPTGATLGQ